MKKNTAKKEDVLVLDDNGQLSFDEYSELKESYENLEMVTNKIKELLNDSVYNYLRIGYLLTLIDEEQLNKLGCDSIYDYSLQNFGIGKTTTKNFISLFKRYALKDNLDPELGIYNRVQLDQKYTDYSMSQLVELLPVDNEEEFEKYSPELSVKEIRALKKESQLSDFEKKKEVELKEIFFDFWFQFTKILNAETFKKDFEFECSDLKDLKFTNKSFDFKCKIKVTKDGKFEPVNFHLFYNKHFDLCLTIQTIQYDYVYSDVYLEIEDVGYSSVDGLEVVEEFFNEFKKEIIDFIKLKTTKEEKEESFFSTEICGSLINKKISFQEFEKVLTDHNVYNECSWLKNWKEKILKLLPNKLSDVDNFIIDGFSYYSIIISFSIRKNLNYKFKLGTYNEYSYYSLTKYDKKNNSETFDFHDYKIFDYDKPLSSYNIEVNESFAIKDLYYEIAMIWAKHEELIPLDDEDETDDDNDDVEDVDFDSYDEEDVEDD